MERSKYTSRLPVVLAMSALAVAGCERVKSATPLSPSIAGPIAGVSITTPAPMQPTAGQKVKDTEQPLTITFGNAESNSVRPYSLTLQVAADPGFTGETFVQSGIQPAPGGVNQFRLPGRLPPGRVYYWRTRAEDGANSSDWSNTATFELLQPIVIGVPTPLSPIGNARATSTSIELRVRNGNSSGPYEPLGYYFQASTSSAFTSLIVNDWVNEGGGETVFKMGSPGPDQTIYWRSRISDGKNEGGWSVVEVFRTPVAGGGGGGGGGGTGGGGSCAGNHGPTIVNCIAAKYPSYLAAGVSHNQREANMAFLRDRVIEAGICGGMQLGWNRKRGNGPHSIDALAWRVNGHDEVVDIGAAYDDTSIPLRLVWGIVAGPPGFDGYPPFSCQ